MKLNRERSFGTRQVAAAVVLLAGLAISPVGMPQQISPLDKASPSKPDGTPIATSILASGDNMCWGDPSTDGRVITGEFGEMRGHKSSPHAGVDMRAAAGNPIYAVADGCVSFGNPTPRQLIGVKQRINDNYPNSSVWYLHMSRVVPKFINDGRSGSCTAIKRGELIGYAGNFYGSGGAEIASGAAHIHMSYFVSGLQLNPAPYEGAPSEIPAEYNIIKSVSAITQQVTGAGFNSSNASGTQGSKLGFAVPRMCNVYTVKATGAKTIPYSPGFGVGSYSANATAPSQFSLEAGQQRVRQSMGISPSGQGSGVISDPTHWSGGMPEEPDWESYNQMSFQQVLQAEVSRRTGDQRWNEQLTEQSIRGLQIEEAWIAALRLKVQHEISLSRQRTEAMYGALLAGRVRRNAIQSAPANLRPTIR